MELTVWRYCEVEGIEEGFTITSKLA